MGVPPAPQGRDAPYNHKGSGGSAGGARRLAAADAGWRPRHPHPSLLPIKGLQGQVCPETGLETWKAHGFSCIFDARKNAKSPEVRRALPIRMAPDSPDPATDYAASHLGAVQGTRPVDVRNHNRQKRTPELRHRRPKLHGRILRRPTAPPASGSATAPTAPRRPRTG